MRLPPSCAAWLDQVHPVMLLLVRHSDGTVDLLPADPVPWGDLRAIAQADPHATVHVYQRDDRLQWQLCLPGPNLGQGWYALCAPEHAPRLVQVEQLFNWRPFRLVRGVDVDTGEILEEQDILYILGRDPAIAEALRAHPEWRPHPPRHLPIEFWTPQW
ncbi:MAG: hypothetical protein OWV35_05440 [Firmicutes bacterium]|nr:hypothetical protein [Bacillota bacterium]